MVLGLYTDIVSRGGRVCDNIPCWTLMMGDFEEENEGGGCGEEGGERERDLGP